MNTKIAAIDFGTNTARLLIAEKNSVTNTFVPLHLERQIVRMGGGFSHKIGLSKEAIERGIDCLQLFSKIMSSYSIDTVRAVATSAVRDAVNGQDFLNMILEKTGIKLAIIDGNKEGELTLQGVLSGLDCHYDSIILFDVGGGSTEYTIMKHGKSLFIKSLPMGVVRLTEGKNSSKEMLLKIDKELHQLKNEMKHQGIEWRTSAMVATAGTATTLAAIKLEMTDYDYRRVNNSQLTFDEISTIYNRLYPLSLEERVQIPGLEKGREDLIIAGGLITIQTMKTFGYSTIKVSDYGLLEGLIITEDDNLL